MKYNYREAMKDNILEFLGDNVPYYYNPADYTDKDEFYEEIYNALWTDDAVTGNASGSYTFNNYTAKEYVCGNLDLLAEALKEFCTPAEEIAERFLNQDFEYFDVTIRCYLLGEVLTEVFENIDEEEFNKEEE